MGGFFQIFAIAGLLAFGSPAARWQQSLARLPLALAHASAEPAAPGPTPAMVSANSTLANSATASVGALPACATPAAKPCPPASPVTIPRPEDDIWIVSSRGCGCTTGCSPTGPPLWYWRYRAARWVQTPASEFWSTLSATTPVSVAMHGNRMSHNDAVQFGWRLYNVSVRYAPHQPAMRFVIWSWPSEKVGGGPLNDARAKAARSDIDARHLAWFLDHLPAGGPLSLVGYSFGVRVIGGALQLVAGGSIDGYRMPNLTRRYRPARLVLMASAMDNDWLLPGRRFGLALEQTEHITLINNGCDRVLKRYGRLYGRGSCQEALGYTGQASPGRLGAEFAKFEQHDVCCLVGPRHDWEEYVGSGTVCGWISRGLAPDVRAAPAPVVAESGEKTGKTAKTPPVSASADRKRVSRAR